MTNAKAEINLVVVDLDNTLYDWIGAFAPSFYDMVEVARGILDSDQETILDDLRAVHQRHGDTEHPFALLETEIVRNRLSHLDHAERVKTLDPAFHAFNRTRKANLRLYEGVAEALERLTNLGVPVVAYTDARVINCLFRLKKLGIRPLINRLYSPGQRERTMVPVGEDSEFVTLLPSEDKKPDPRTLIDICEAMGTKPDASLYVGDSLLRDVWMAKQAGCHSAWARYGTLFDRELWPKLVRVTHWTDAEVRHETALREAAGVIQPECVLDKFSDIFGHFMFRPPNHELTSGSA